MSQPGTSMSDAPKGKANFRTALILLSVAAVFFVGVIVKRWLAGA